MKTKVYINLTIFVMSMVVLSVFGGCGEHMPDAPDIDEIKQDFQETLDVQIDGQSCPGMSIDVGYRNY